MQSRRTLVCFAEGPKEANIDTVLWKRVGSVQRWARETREVRRIEILWKKR